MASTEYSLTNTPNVLFELKSATDVDPRPCRCKGVALYYIMIRSPFLMAKM